MRDIIASIEKQYLSEATLKSDNGTVDMNFIIGELSSISKMCRHLSNKKTTPEYVSRGVGVILDNLARVFYELSKENKEMTLIQHHMDTANRELMVGNESKKVTP
jgi:hypothetical protein